MIPGEGDDPGGGTAPGCTVTYDEIAVPVKVLFLVDKTGSNYDDSNTAAVKDGTDPNKTWRVGSMNNLMNGLDLNFFSFNITLFRGNSSNIYDNNRYGGSGGEVTKSLISGFSNKVSVINNAMNALNSDPDKGKTPYQAALARARDTIKADILNDAASMYSVIMVTDGHPDPNLATKTNCGSRACSTENGADVDLAGSIAKARAFASEITSINPQRVNVNTVYYYNAGMRKSNPVSILSNIADAGKGAFIEAISNQTIDFKNVVRVPNGSVCP